MHGNLRLRERMPDVISYSFAISACDKGGELRHASGLLVGVRNNNVLPDVISCNSAISACEKGGQWQRVLGWLVDMRHND